MNNNTVSRISYTAEHKTQVIEYAKANSQAEAARKFGINKSQISRWVKNSRMIRGAPRAHTRIKASNNAPRLEQVEVAKRGQEKRFTIPSLLEAISVVEPSKDELFVAKLLVDPTLWMTKTNGENPSIPKPLVQYYSHGKDQNTMPVYLGDYYSLSVDPSLNTNIKVVYS